MLITSSFDNFRKFLDNSDKFIRTLDSKAITSPYIFQSIGNAVGSRNIDFAKRFNIFSDTALSAKQFFPDIPAEQLQAVAEDMKLLITAVLLGHNGFIDTLSELIYDSFAGKDKLNEINKDVANKFKALDAAIKQYKYSSGGFVFLSHYSADADIEQFYPFGKYFIDQTEKYIQMLPSVTEITLDNFSGKKNIGGWLILLPLSPKMLLQNKKLREHHILQATKLTEILGASMMGLGGLLGSVTMGGKSITKNLNVNLTTGHAYTVANIVKMVDMVAEKLSLKYANTALAIVGACGSVGSCCSELFSTKGFKKIILIDTEAAVRSDLCQTLLAKMKYDKISCEIIIDSDISKINSADIVVVATSMPVAIIDDATVKKGCIVIDDSYPKNVSLQTVQKRKDIIFLEGGATQLPLDVKIMSSQEIPNLEFAPSSRLFYNNQSYSCLSEIITLCLDGHNRHYGLGRASVELAKEMLVRPKKWYLKPALVECYGDDLTDSRLKDFKIHSER